MPRIKIDNKIVISYDDTARQKYWTALSQFLIDKHGNQHFSKHQKVEEILVDAFNFCANEFEQATAKENRLSFYTYVFWLHEQSVSIYQKTLGGFKLELIDEFEFAMYRRVLKLILEQGCDHNLLPMDMPSGHQVIDFDKSIQELLYLGNWLYGFADCIAYQKMVEECNAVWFDENNLLVFNWQFHYGDVYRMFIPKFATHYVNSIFDEQAILDLKNKIEECFKIDYSYGMGIIMEIKKHFGKTAYDLQHIDPAILPINLVNEFKIDSTSAQAFYNGLSISKDNKLTVSEAVLNPYSTKRYMYRPILIYTVNGEKRALVGEEKIVESMIILATNAMHWNAMPAEWLTNKCMQNFMNSKGAGHDKLLEDRIEKIIIERSLRFCRNIKAFKGQNNTSTRIDNATVGEIDFLIIDYTKKVVFVSEAKYNKARYEGVGFRMDNSNFINDYERKLKRKVDWIANNIEVVQTHLRIIYNDESINLSGYDVQGIFLINTPTFYMYNGNFKAIPLKNLSAFLVGEFEYKTLIFTHQNDEIEMVSMIFHPYFRKPNVVVEE